jgi:hypothetical protein
LSNNERPDLWETLIIYQVTILYEENCSI